MRIADGERAGVTPAVIGGKRVMIFQTTRSRLTARILLGVSLLAASTALHAQATTETSPPDVQNGSTSNGPTDDSEIVVTALKRATSIQQTPISISAVSAASLTAQGITDSAQLTRTAPNLVINENANGGSRVIIRNLYAAGEPLVGLYYDETPITGTSGVSNDAGGTQPSIRLFDVERAEVLRGPQGTLYGASSMGGTIRLIFAKPNLGKVEGALNGQLTDVSHGSGSVGTSVDGMVNLPVIENVLAVRAVGFWDHTAGFVDNSVLGVNDFNRNRSYGGRLLARFRPTERLTIDGMAVYQNRRGFNPTWNLAKSEVTGDRYDQDLRIRTPQKDAFELYSGTVNWDMDFATLTAIASHSKRSLDINFDYSPYFSRYYTGKTPASKVPGYANFAADCNRGLVSGLNSCSADEYQRFVTNWGVLTAYQPQSTKTDTQEIRIADAQHPLKWTIGFFHSKRQNYTQSLLNTVDPVTGFQVYPNGYSANPYGFNSTTQLDRRINDTLKQIAGFGELTWDVNEKLSLTTGIRYFEYKKITGAETLIPNYVAGNTRSPYSELKGKENGKLLKFNASYKFTRNLMVYGLAAQGYRPGGVNQTLGLPSYASTYESDKLWNYEGGVKSSWFNRKLVFNIDAFQMDWSNVQMSASYQSAFSFITNTPSKIRIRGIEADSTLYPMEGLTLRASGSYTSAKLQDDVSLPAGINLCTGSPPYVDCAVLTGIGRKGNTVPYSPKWTLQGSADYTQPIGNDLSIFYHGDISYRSASWTVFDHTAANVTPGGMRLPGFATVGLRVGLEKGENWGIYAFANNLFDVIGAVSKSTSATSSTLSPFVSGGVTYPSVYVTSSPPRVIGLSARTRF
ncbi:TonB-dependent receptor [Sphingomonas paeninsulae]|uniref:TonB-dependent receptor n=1 Tax=Sphingomonas paeninsulae TaxID=2319844 RepID=A0A494TL49_SPHPE|nr:TonB-dependent receptor [Sphingomonas paeninsulae]AYJ85835.1 TonB-dependent receptor [Sphingomonas paeninsulae]